MKEREEYCKDCDYRTHNPYIMSNGHSLHCCHKNAPIPNPKTEDRYGDEALWSYVSDYNWCGEFKKKCTENKYM